METAYYIIKNVLSLQNWLLLLAVFIATLVVSRMIAKRRWTQAVLVALLCTYIFFALLITLISRTPASEPKAKLIPFWSWYEVIVHHDKGLFYEIILNILLLVPVGVLMRLLGVIGRHVVIFCLCLSLGIELTQYFSCLGLCEIWDDVIHNSVGGILGWLGCEYVVGGIHRRGENAK
ncbi:MAG: VanZ family protein [Oscillospiraceae bacterium]|nr:VanZ family protein [Oscillospiraceae bacterium]